MKQPAATTLALLTLATTYCGSVNASAEEVTITPAGLQIIWQELKKEFDGFRVLNGEKGVHAVLAVKSGKKKIITFHEKESKVAINDGTQDLDGKFNFWNKISKDGKTMKLDLQTKKLPAADTKAFHIKGSFDITLASTSETGKAGPRNYKKGDMIEIADDFKFEISDLGKPKWGDEPLEITFKWKRKVPDLAAVRFYDEAGKLIKSESGGSSSMGFGTKWTVTKSYKLKRKSDILKIEIDLWTDSETVTIPLDMKLGLNGQVK